MTGTKEERKAYEAADRLKKSVLSRIGVPAEQLQCPREKSGRNPCVARDGQLAVAFDTYGKSICVGCERNVLRLLQDEEGRAP